MRHLLIPLVLLFFSSNSAFSQVKVSGYVIEMSTGEPIKNATVFVHDEFNIAFESPIQVLTNEKGYYEFSDFKKGKYNINVFVYYEALGDTLAYIYQPGTLTVPDSYYIPAARGMELNFAFHKEEFLHTYYTRKAAKHGTITQLSEIDNAYYSFLKPKFTLSPQKYLKRAESRFIEKKTW